MVYITQNRVDKDLSAAHVYGPLKFIIPTSMSELDDRKTIVKKVKAELQYFTSDDYLVLIGSPSLLCLIAIYAVDRLRSIGHKKLQLLQWDRRGEYYLPIIIDV